MANGNERSQGILAASFDAGLTAVLQDGLLVRVQEVGRRVASNSRPISFQKEKQRNFTLPDPVALNCSEMGL